jgi:hypothetical protein
MWDLHLTISNNHAIRKIVILISNLADAGCPRSR